MNATYFTLAGTDHLLSDTFSGDVEAVRRHAGW